jgi:hypothetical protein
MCCCCCCGRSGDVPSPGGAPSGEPPGGVEPTPLCTRYEVAFTRLDVSRSDDGFGAGELEVTIFYSVNGQVERQDFVTAALQEQVYQLNFRFLANVPTRNSVISVSVQAREEDNNHYTGINDRWEESQNWGVGEHTRTLGGANEPLLATVTYVITCVDSVVVAVSQSALVAYAQAAASRRQLEAQPSKRLLTWSLNKLLRGGWEILHVSNGDYILRGFGPFAASIEEQYGEKR